MALNQPQLLSVHDSSDDPGGLFRRLGKLFKQIEDNRLYQITTADADTTAILEELVDAAIPLSDLDLLPGVERAIYGNRQDRNGWTSALMSMASSLATEHINALDTLYVTDDDTVISFLKRLMKDAGDTNDGDRSFVLTRPVLAIGPEVRHYDITGDGPINITHHNKLGNDDATSVNHPDTVNFPDVVYTQDSVMGRQFSYMREEKIDFVITSKTSTTKGTWTKYGEPDRSDRENYKWPGGSGFGTTIPVCDRKVDAASAAVARGKNVLGNSDFEDFTANLPDKWEADEGVAGTDFRLDAANEYEGTNCLEFIGTAATIAPRVRQKFNDDTDGTIGALKKSTKYCCEFWLKGSTASVGVGNFEVRIKIGSGWEAAYKTDLTSIPTVYTRYHFFFNTPATLPANGVAYAIFVGVAAGDDLDLSDSVFFDFLGIVEVTEQGNLHMAAFNGKTDFALDDRVTRALTNTSPHGGGSAGKFGFYFDQMWGLWEKSIVLEDETNPSGTQQTPADSLIS